MKKYLPIEAVPVTAIQFRTDGEFIEDLKVALPKGEYALDVRFFGDSVTFPVRLSINYAGRDYDLTISEAGTYLVVKNDELQILSKESFFEDYVEVEEENNRMGKVAPWQWPPSSPAVPPFDPTQPWITYNSVGGRI